MLNLNDNVVLNLSNEHEGIILIQNEDVENMNVDKIFEEVKDNLFNENYSYKLLREIGYFLESRNMDIDEINELFDGYLISYIQSFVCDGRIRKLLYHERKQTILLNVKSVIMNFSFSDEDGNIIKFNSY